MRGDGGKVFLDVEASRAAYELRKPDAPRRTAEALARARRLDDVDRARELADVLISNQHRRLDPDDPGPNPETLVKHRRRRQRLQIAGGTCLTSARVYGRFRPFLSQAPSFGRRPPHVLKRFVI